VFAWPAFLPLEPLHQPSIAISDLFIALSFLSLKPRLIFHLCCPRPSTMLTLNRYSVRAELSAQDQGARKPAEITSFILEDLTQSLRLPAPRTESHCPHWILTLHHLGSIWFFPSSLAPLTRSSLSPPACSSPAVSGPALGPPGRAAWLCPHSISLSSTTSSLLGHSAPLSGQLLPSLV
jgi:hypothetical protein